MAAHVCRKEFDMGKIGIGLAVVVALALVGFGLIAATVRPRVQPPQYVSMQDSGRALAADAGVMQTHGQAMIDEGQRTGDQELVAAGELWLADGQQLSQRAQWLVMDPLAPGNLTVPPSQLSQQGNWGSLIQTAQAMVHDPSQVRTPMDMEALRWNGLSMEAEGRAIADHGRAMLDQVDAMSAHHPVDPQTANVLRHAAQTMEIVGNNLEQNGQAMRDYADRLRRSLGYL
jgi:hypothetical protein